MPGRVRRAPERAAADGACRSRWRPARWCWPPVASSKYTYVDNTTDKTYMRRPHGVEGHRRCTATTEQGACQPGAVAAGVRRRRPSPKSATRGPGLAHRAGRPPDACSTWAPARPTPCHPTTSAPAVSPMQADPLDAAATRRPRPRARSRTSRSTIRKGGLKGSHVVYNASRATWQAHGRRSTRPRSSTRSSTPTRSTGAAHVQGLRAEHPLQQRVLREEQSARSPTSSTPGR